MSVDDQIVALEEHIIEETFDVELIAQADSILQRAFGVSQISPTSASSFLARSQPSQQLRPLKKCSRNWTRMVYAQETRPAKFPRTPLRETDFRSASIMRIVNELPEQKLCWIKHCYMSSTQAAHEYGSRFLSSFWREYAQLLPPGCRLDRVLLQRLANLLVFSRVDNYLSSVVDAGALWDFFCVSKSNWHKRYAPEKVRMQRMLELHHNRCLMTILHNMV